MIRTLECKDIKGRPTLGLYQNGNLVCEVKSHSAMAPEGNPSRLMETRAIDTVARTATGLYSILGIKDNTRDRLHQPAFEKTIKERVEGGKKVRFLWNHDQMQPPIATIKSMKILGREGVPTAVLADYPEATGAVEVTREYHDFPTADAVFKNIASDGLNEMSFGFIPMNFSFTKENEEDPLWKATREIYELKLYEVSDVHWGANPATIAVRAERDVLEDWKCLIDQLKAGKGISVEQRSQMLEGYELLRKAFEGAEGAAATEKPAEEKSEGEARPDVSHAFSLQMNQAKALIFDLECET